MTRTTRIGLVGTGWRLTPYLTVVDALPGEFEVVAALTRSEQSAARIGAERGIPASTSMATFLAQGPLDFVLLSVPRDSALPLAGALLDAGLPVLGETPIAAHTGELAPFVARYGLDAPLQSAEQYRLQPMHAARIAVARSGRIGQVHHVTASFAHDYHAFSVIREVLRIGFEPVTVRAAETIDRAVQPLGRDGWSADLTVGTDTRTVAQLQWTDRDLTATYDFAGEQYFSPIRTRHIAIRGTHGELVDDRVHVIDRPGEPVTLPLTREQTGVDGDLQGFTLRAVRLGGETVWRSRVAPARLADDEIAVAGVLRAMAAFVCGGAPFYGIADAAEDLYLTELVGRAVAAEGPVTGAERPWLNSRA
ncbi:Gfo/Idh/MocA family protein [uncultured Amnibacterium sp.]|uniref:Gfo/Idh/MocA family protein n=1 Tax=uncultured Amnibacterium sp. TaxID=1631851 RepID=UPI0035CC8620